VVLDSVFLVNCMTNNNSHDDRLTTLEVQRTYESEAIQRLEANLAEVAADVSEIKNSLGKQRGFVAGAVAVVSLVWGVVLAAATFLLNGRSTPS